MLLIKLLSKVLAFAICWLIVIGVFVGIIAGVVWFASKCGEHEWLLPLTIVATASLFITCGIFFSGSSEQDRLR